MCIVLHYINVCNTWHTNTLLLYCKIKTLDGSTSSLGSLGVWTRRKHSSLAHVFIQRFCQNSRILTVFFARIGQWTEVILPLWLYNCSDLFWSFWSSKTLGFLPSKVSVLWVFPGSRASQCGGGGADSGICLGAQTFLGQGLKNRSSTWIIDHFMIFQCCEIGAVDNLNVVFLEHLDTFGWNNLARHSRESLQGWLHFNVPTARKPVGGDVWSQPRSEAVWNPWAANAVICRQCASSCRINVCFANVL